MLAKILLKKKTELYQPNINNQLADRTKPIDSNIPSRARLIRLMDKIHNTLFSAERA